MKQMLISPRTGFFTVLTALVLNSGSVRLASADVLDSSLIVRFNFDAAPIGDVIVDTSPAGGHPGTNILATWTASEAGRQGVMNFDGTVPNQITLAAAPALNSTVGTIAFWMKSTNVTQLPIPHAVLFDRRTLAGDVIYQDSNGHLENQAFSGGNANAQTTGPTLPTANGTMWRMCITRPSQGPSPFTLMAYWTRAFLTHWDGHGCRISRST